MEDRERFLELYKELEQRAILAFGYKDDGRAVSHLIKRPEMKDLQIALKAAREIRNILSHYSGEVATPSRKLILALEIALERVSKRRKVKDIMTPYSNLLSASKSDKVLEALTAMNEKGYSYLPILEDRMLIGLVSPKSILSLVTKPHLIDSETTFGALLKHFAITPLTQHVGFARLDDDRETIYRRFRSKSVSSRLDIILVTDSGDYRGRLRGIIVPNDL